MSEGEWVAQGLWTSRFLSALSRFCRQASVSSYLHHREQLGGWADEGLGDDTERLRVSCGGVRYLELLSKVQVHDHDVLSPAGSRLHEEEPVAKVTERLVAAAGAADADAVAVAVELACKRRGVHSGGMTMMLEFRRGSCAFHVSKEL